VDAIKLEENKKEVNTCHTWLISFCNNINGESNKKCQGQYKQVYEKRDDPEIPHREANGLRFHKIVKYQNMIN